MSNAELIADLNLNHEYCPKEVILAAADELEAAYKRIAELERKLAVVREALKKFGKMKHYFCEDGWYSCPKAEDGCFNDAKALREFAEFLRTKRAKHEA